MSVRMTEGLRVLVHMYWLLLSVNILAIKGWARPVAAAAVIPAPRVVVAFIGPKAFVAGSVSSW
jgi:hypothetical protein